MERNVPSFQRGHRLELYVAKEVADSLIAIASKFNVEAQIIGRVEASQEKKLTIKSEYGTFEY